MIFPVIHSALVGQVDFATPDLPSSDFSFIMPSEEDLVQHRSRLASLEKLVFNIEQVQHYALCELSIAARKGLLGSRFELLQKELLDRINNLLPVFSTRPHMNGRQFLLNIYSAVCTVDFQTRRAVAHSIFRATAEYRITIENGGKDFEKEWTWEPIIDTGASCCMTNNKDILVNFRIFLPQDAPGVTIADHSVILADGTGDLHLANNLIIKDVLYLKKLGTDLLSIRQLQNLLRTRYTDHEDGYCMITKGDKEIGVTYMDTVHGLYRIKLVLKNPYLLKATTYIPPTFETRVQQAYSALPVSARIPKSLLPPGWNEDYRNATNHDLYILYKLWHARLLYQSPDALRKLEKGGLLKGFAVPLYPEGSCPCITCARCKMVTGTHPQADRLKFNARGALICGDLAGPITPRSIGGSNYFMVITDFYSGYVVVKFLVHKSEAAKALMDTILLFNTQLSEGGERHVVKNFRSDNGGEFLNKELDAFFITQGIVRQTTGGYNSEANGTAERMIRTLKEKARCGMYASSLPMNLWAEAINTAAFVQNFSFHSRTKMTPYALFTGFKPDGTIFRVLGCRVFALIALKLRGSDGLTSTSFSGVFLGYAPNSKGYRILYYDPKLGRNRIRVIRTADCRFFENEFPYYNNKMFELLDASAPLREHLTDEQFSTLLPDLPKNTQGMSTLPDTIDETPDEFANAPYTSHPTMDPWSMPLPSAPLLVDKVFPTALLPSPADQGVNVGGHQLRSTERRKIDYSVYFTPSLTSTLLTKMKDDIFECTHYWTSGEHSSYFSGGVTPLPIFDIPTSPISIASGSETLFSSPSAFSALPGGTDPNLPFGSADPWLGRRVASCQPVPDSEAKMRKHEFCDGWILAMEEEYKSLFEMGVFIDIPRSEMSPGRVPMTCRWVYTYKESPDGLITALKARFVVRGFEQKKYIDFDETFAHVSRLTSIRVIFAVACARGYEIRQIDFKTAFLNGVLDEEVYVLPPAGIGPETDGVWKLNKALYGLKQAPRAWNETLHQAMLSLGFRSSEAEPSLYYKYISSGLVLVPFYVDDGLIVGTASPEFEETVQDILKLFKSKDMGEAEKFVGFKITRDRLNHTLMLSQAVYAQEVVDRFLPFADNKHPRRCCPIDPSESLARDDGSPLLDTKIYKYASLIGALLYLTNCTRPDLAFAVNSLAKYMACPTTKHWHVALEVIRHLSSTINDGIVYSGTSLVPIGWSDASFANDRDDRRSVSGVAFILANGIVDWAASRQTVMANSSTMSEYIAANLATRNALYISSLLDICQVSSRPLHIYMDNQPAILLTQNPLTNGAVKHIEIIYHFVRYNVRVRNISVSYISTADMLADGLTKLLPTSKHNACKRGFGIRSSLAPFTGQTSDGPLESSDEDVYAGVAALLDSLNPFR